MSERCAENGIMYVGATSPVSIQIMYFREIGPTVQIKLSGRTVYS